MKNNANTSLEISVIISTYNRPDALDLVLSALAEQDHPKFEVIVADDGSTETTASLIRAHQLSQRCPLNHVWQPDEGFRKAEIHNQAILKAAGEYVVFLDGDCVARTNWLSRHAALARRERFVTGSKIKLSPAFTNEVLTCRLPLHRSTLKLAAWMRLTKRANHFLYFTSLPDGRWRNYKPRSSRRMYGCNMAVWTKDLKAVGGFDERYRGWGSEDRDLAARLINAGIYRKEGRYATDVLHLWHREADRNRKEHNRHLLQTVVQTGATRAMKGIDQYIGRYDENFPQAESSDDETTRQRSSPSEARNDGEDSG